MTLERVSQLNKNGQVGIWLLVSVPLHLGDKVSDCLHELCWYAGKHMLSGGGGIGVTWKVTFSHDQAVIILLKLWARCWRNGCRNHICNNAPGPRRWMGAIRSTSAWNRSSFWKYGTIFLIYTRQSPVIRIQSYSLKLHARKCSIGQPPL